MDILSKLFGPPVESINAAQAEKKLAEKPRPFLLDVRQPEEFRGGHIPGAKLIPLGELATRLKELPKNQTIIIVCQSGSRSSSAARQLTKAGYQVLNLQGGMSAWARSGKPVTRAK